MSSRLINNLMLTLIAFTPSFAFRSRTCVRRVPSVQRLFLHTDEAPEDLTSSKNELDDEVIAPYTPWSRQARDRSEKKRNKTRFRQHVNPLASQFQLPTILSEEWPKDVFSDVSRPLHLDIGCGKGGFLLEVAEARPEKNHLGLEIRPSVVQFAKERIARHDLTGSLDYVGCNANVDLDRILKRYSEAGGGPLTIVSIQFPDPHFKSAHVKRRVVTSSLVATLAKFMPAEATLFLQSDIQEVLDDMRARFREHSQFFEDQVESVEEYMEKNIIGIPTEREISVLNKDLPVFRSVFMRTSTPIVSVNKE